MAKYDITYLMDSKYAPSNNRNPVEFNFYKSGIFDGFGDCSYYTVTSAGRELYKKAIPKEYYTTSKQTISELILFITNPLFDSITTEELDYIKSDEYWVLSQYLNSTRAIEFNINNFDIQFENDFRQFELSWPNKLNNFSIHDIGKLPDNYHYYKSTELNNIYDNMGKIDECYVGKIFIKRGDRTIKIPIIRPINGTIRIGCKVEIKGIQANVDIFKCLLFVAKQNCLRHLFENGFTNVIFWKNHLDFYYAGSSNKHFNYFRII